MRDWEAERLEPGHVVLQGGHTWRIERVWGRDGRVMLDVRNAYLPPHSPLVEIAAAEAGLSRWRSYAPISTRRVRL